jgi:hypothetical protein
VHIMVDVERQRVAQRTAQPPLLAVMDPEEEAAASQAPASEAAA